MTLNHHIILLCLFIWQLFMLLLFVVYRLRYVQERAFSFFLTAKYLQLATMILLLLQEILDSQLIIPLCVLLGLAGGILESLALLILLRVLGNKLEQYYIILFGISIVAVVLMYLFVHDQQLIVVAFCLLGVLILAPQVYTLSVIVAETSLHKIMGLLYCVVILSLIGRALEPVFLEIGSNTVDPQFLNSYLYIVLYLYVVLGTAGIMLLYREDSFSELERVATYDELTGILNRGSFVQRAKPLIIESALKKIPYSFVLLDVDHFKNINDTYGHTMGDLVLRDLVGKIEQQLGKGNLFGRFGGEEFAVLLPNSNRESSDRITEQMRAAMIGSVIQDVQLDYTISIGVITVESGERLSLNQLYKLSDTALYQAKSNGRNCVIRSYENTEVSS